MAGESDTTVCSAEPEGKIERLAKHFDHMAEAAEKNHFDAILHSEADRYNIEEQVWKRAAVQCRQAIGIPGSAETRKPNP